MISWYETSMFCHVFFFNLNLIDNKYLLIKWYLYRLTSQSNNTLEIKPILTFNSFPSTVNHLSLKSKHVSKNLT